MSAFALKTSIRRFLSLVVASSLTVLSNAYGASFDCKQAKSPDERAICDSRQLSELDVEMSVRYEMLTGLVAMGARGAMQDEQQAWLNMRRKCRNNQACLLSSYRHRIEMLKEDYARLASRGPF